MKLFRILLSGLLISSQFVSADSHSIYYQEFKALKNNPTTSILFDEELDGGSYTNQCNLEMYRPWMGDIGYFAQADQLRRALSLGAINRDIATAKQLSFFKLLLQRGLSDADADLIIVTPETMPALYDYVADIAQKANIATPVVFISLKQGLFKTFSRKICMFTGSMVIGQQLLHDVSQEELEALVAQEIGRIKHNHTNKKFVLDIAVMTAFLMAVKENKTIFKSKFIGYFMVPALSYLILGKWFEKQADTFASEVAKKADGLIKFYQRLQMRDQARDAGFDTAFRTINENATQMSMLAYICIMMNYYLAKAEVCAAKLYNKYAYPSHEERIAAAQQYLQQEA